MSKKYSLRTVRSSNKTIDFSHRELYKFYSNNKIYNIEKTMEKDIKSSVRLPKTTFEMKGNLSALEEKVLKAWHEKNIYNQIQKKNLGRKKFVLHDGPPYANGNLHVGHALNKILKDIVLKSYLNMGYDAPYVMGWDCHGLPIEWKIEEKYKEKGIPKENINVVDFRQECRDFAAGWVDIQKQQFADLGVISDSAPYVTMDFKAEALTVSAVFDLLEKGLLYQGKKPILWSCVEKTALAEAEVEYQDKKSDTAYVGFKVAKAAKEAWVGAYTVIWTTTPWTLPSNQAIAYGENISYGLFKVEELEEEALIKPGTNIIIAEELQNTVFAELKIKKATKIDSQLGLLGFEMQHCLFNMGYDFVVPALAGDFVDISTGTGLVHIAPSHGEDDFYLCKKYNVTPKELVLDGGNFVAETPIFAGEHIFKVNPKVLEKLLEHGSLFAKKQILHSYPHSWRSKAPLIYRLTTQWFISLDKDNTRKKAIDALECVEFFPETGRNRLRSMLEGRPDWCISRQRSWGVPLSIFVHNKTKEPIVDKEVFNNVISAFEKEGASAWFAADPKRFLTPKYNKDDYYVVSDVLDVWVDSGLSNYFVLKQRPELSYPADLYLEGSDQHRGWFQSSLVMSLLLFGKAPYKKILTHGFVLDEKNQKMSKSLGNVVVPQDAIKTYGADVLRIWVATSNFMEDVSIGKNILTQQAESYRKIRNTLRYLLANLSNKPTAVPYEQLEEVDKWVLHNVYSLDNMFKQTFEKNFSLHSFFNKVFNFIIGDLSAFYFDIKKDILYCDKENSAKYLATITTLDILFNYLIKWLSPYIPFTAEEAFSIYSKEEIGSLFLQDFQNAQGAWNNEVLFNKWEKIKKIRRVVTGAIEQERAKKVIGSSLESAPIVFVCKQDEDVLSSINFAEVCITSNITIKNIEQATDDVFALADVDNVKVSFEKHNGHKCQRCWKFYEELHEELCERCYDFMEGYNG
jgi:isoleucyl-tRNA synthetase